MNREVRNRAKWPLQGRALKEDTSDHGADAYELAFSKARGCLEHQAEPERELMVGDVRGGMSGSRPCLAVSAACGRLYGLWSAARDRCTADRAPVRLGARTSVGIRS